MTEGTQKPSKGKVNWYWLIVVLVVGMRLGMDVQHHMDLKVMSIMGDTIDKCVDFMEQLNQGAQDSDTYHLI